MTKSHTRASSVNQHLDDKIPSLSTRFDAATYELLVMIREFDERCGWLQWSLASCAEWLAWRTR